MNREAAGYEVCLLRFGYKHDEGSEHGSRPQGALQPRQVDSQKGDGTLTVDNTMKSAKGVEALKSLGVKVRNIEQPAKESEAKDTLIKAFREKLSVMPVGGGTTLAAGVLPEHVDMVLDTTGMNGVVAFDAANLNITVQSGMTINAINDYIGSHGRGFRLPLDPPFSDRATIGGVFAANGSGPSRLRFGTVRDQVLGVRGIDAGGAEVKFGGKVVKNVSGYDMTKFLIGSAGSLCLITALTLRVYPMPGAACACEATFGKLDQLEKFLAALKASALLPSGIVVEQANGAYRVTAGFEEHPMAVERESKEFLSITRSAGGDGASRAGREAMQEAFRNAIEPDKEGVAFKITVPISNGPKILEAAKKLLPQAKVVLYAGNGVICIYTAQADAVLIKQLRGLIDGIDGYLVPLRLSQTLLSKWGSRVDATLGQYVLQPIKKQLDPSGIFPPVLQ